MKLYIVFAFTAVTLVWSVSSLIAFEAPVATTCPATQPAPVQPLLHQGDGWAMCVPGNWREFKQVRAPMQFYLVGDGKDGIPMTDGTLSVLKAGLTVEVFRNRKGTLLEHVTNDVKELKESGAFELLFEPRVQNVLLADGTRAITLDAEFVRKENGRVSIHSKVYSADARGRAVVVTGFLTCSRPGLLSVKATGLSAFVRAHVTSLVFDAAKLDLVTAKAAYEQVNWSADRAIELASEANDLLEKSDYQKSMTAFREAIQLTDNLPAAHNGLAWALLHAEPVTPNAIEQAIGEAKLAVEQTAELDYSAMDTLALAYYRSGDKESAVKTIERALKLRPNDPELKARLKSFK
jgi:hypothetical protein